MSSCFRLTVAMTCAIVVVSTTLSWAGTARAAAAAPLFGFNDNYATGGPGPYDQRAQLAAQLTAADGGNVDRVTIDWKGVEPARGVWSWGAADTVYAHDIADGIRPIFGAAFAPGWANPSAAAACMLSGCNFPPLSLYDSDWKSFVTQMALRYPQLAAIEIWNEPNLEFFWAPRVNVARYTTLLKEAYAAIKSVRPGMTVLSGGLCSCGFQDNQPDPGDLTAADFLSGIYGNGGGPSMDAIAVHDYPGSLSGTSDTYVNQILSSVRAVRDAYGDSSKSLWITESGLRINASPWYWTEAQQAAEDVHLYQLFSGMSDVADVNIHTLVDNPNEPGWGVLNSDLTPRPAYCQLAQARGVSPPAGC